MEFEDYLIGELPSMIAIWKNCKAVEDLVATEIWNLVQNPQSRLVLKKVLAFNKAILLVLYSMLYERKRCYRQINPDYDDYISYDDFIYGEVL